MQNNEYETAGAKLVDTAAALGSDIVLKVRPPSVDTEVPLLKPGGNLISYIQPAVNTDLVAQLGEKKMNVIGASPLRPFACMLTCACPGVFARTPCPVGTRA